MLQPFKQSMKATSGHFIFDADFQYQELEAIFPEILKMFLEETDQMPDDEDVLQMFIFINQQALRKNQKPEGYNRKGRMRMVFPLGSKQFYLKSNVAGSEVVRLSEKVSKILSKAGIKHSLQWNALGGEEA
jgi:hypothetical protein